MISRMLLSSCVLVFLLCLLHECNGRHLTTIDDHTVNENAKHLSHYSTIKGFGNDPLRVQDDDLNLKSTARVKDQTNTSDNDRYKQTDCGSKNKKDKIQEQRVKKFKELVHRHQRKHHAKFLSFQVPPRNKQVHQQPGFNLDYSPPKTHPPSHN